ncbi:MAG: hypothetical protein WBF58_23190 [Xanthobacteraceae bacterium]
MTYPRRTHWYALTAIPLFVIASEAKQSSSSAQFWVASSLPLLAMTREGQTSGANQKPRREDEMLFPSHPRAQRVVGKGQ